MSKTPVLPLFAQALGATPAEIGWIVIASTIPGILISFPAGSLSDYLGKRRVIFFSLLIFASAPFLYLVVSEVWQLIAVRFYHGFATAIFGTVATAAIAERYVRDRAARLSTYSSVTIVGRSIAPFLGGFLISLASFDAVYIACGVSGVLALAVGLMLNDSGAPAPIPKPERINFFASLKMVLRDARIMVTTFVEAVQYLVFGAVEAFLALFAATLGIPAWQIGVILGVQLVSIVFIKPLMGVLSDKIGRARIIIPGLLVGALSVALLPWLPYFLGLCALSLLFGVGFAMVTSSTSALVADLTKGGEYGSSMGVLRTVMDVGQTIGPVLTGAVVGVYGYASAFVLLGAISLGAALVFSHVMRAP
ncbi:MAG: MFS transporter [Gammaproteobacteria bacterium]|nr:MFS transporter [Gammaproteobacteria bacterium]